MKKMNIMLGLATVILTGVTGPAFATSSVTTHIGGATLGKGIIDFDALDGDNNGMLTADEVNNNAFFDGDSFSDVDKNDDGMVDGEELSKWARSNGKGNAVGSVRGNASVPIRDHHGNLVPLAPLAPVRPGDVGAVTK